MPDALLHSIAAGAEPSGAADDWQKLRELIRHTLDRNVALFTDAPPPAPAPFNPTPSTQGGLRLPPFPQKKLSQLHMYDPPLSYLTPAQTKDALQAISDQLDSFDEPPFTVQRLCELLLTPKKHYKSIGKYLRAVEKSILVTSTVTAFPIEQSTSAPSNGHRGNSRPHTTPLAFATRSTPSTPLFSPIAFLHEDARLRSSRSRSRSISPTRGLGDREATHPPASPPPDSEPGTPLLLIAELPSKPNEEADGADPLKAEPALGLGMVDEMDDPSPGHMSEAPTPLTTIAAQENTASHKPFLGSLQERFVKSGSNDDSAESNTDDKAQDAKKLKSEDSDPSIDENRMELDTVESKS